MVTNPASLFLPLLLPLQCAAPAWTQGLTTPLFLPSSSLFFHRLFHFFLSLPCLLVCLYWLCHPSPIPTKNVSSHKCFTMYLDCHSLVNCIFPIVNFIYFSTLFISVWSSTLVICCRPRRLRLKQTQIAPLPHPSPPLPRNLSAPVPHIPFWLLFWIVGILFFFYFIFVFFNETNVQHSCA